MQVTVHEHVGSALTLLIEGATWEQVEDAFWNGLKSPFNGKVSVLGPPRIGQRQDGALLMRCEPNEGVTSGDVVFVMKLQLTHHAKASA